MEKLKKSQESKCRYIYYKLYINTDPFYFFLIKQPRSNSNAYLKTFS